tara:strand:+ start:13451 stop:14374 length:924 start_codon:yes stop_codon:yes gene_type:complete
MKKNIVYKMVTDKVVAGLKKEGLQWFKPWSHNGKCVSPISYTSKKEYNGINRLFLSFAMRENGWIRPEFITFNQAKALGGTIIKGSKSQEVVYYTVCFIVKDKFYKTEKALNLAGYRKGQAGVTDIWTPKYFRVFNIEQVEDIKPLESVVIEEATEESVFNPLPNADSVYDNYKNSPTLAHGGGQAYYRPSNDWVQMPKQTTFVDGDSYYKTLFHELIHSTGHEGRLKRAGIMEVNRFGSKEYSKEELVAEIGSMMLVAITGLEPKDSDENSQAYINGWCKKLTENEQWVLFASSQAEKSVKHILNR